MKYLRKNRIKYIYVLAVLMLLGACLFGISHGATRINPFDALRSLLSGDLNGVEARILFYVRLPRVLASVVCGAALALSGAVIQGVLNNILASPSIIGVNAGAGLAVTLCVSLGIVGGWRLSLFAFIGALLTVAVVSIGAKRWGASRGTVILMGVAINALLGAVSDTVTTLAPTVQVLSNDFRIGDFSAVTYAKLLPATAIAVFSAAVLFTLSNVLDILTVGDDNAKSLGVNVSLMRVVFLILSALLAGAAVSVAGLLSFVGLLVPHAVRRIATNAHKHLLPLCALLGGGFVTLCDTLSRCIFADYELPVGIIMAFIGAPFFIFILVKGRGVRVND